VLSPVAALLLKRQSQKLMIWGGNYLGIMIWGETYLGIMMRSHQTRDYMCHAALELRAMYICEEMPAHHAE